MGAAQETWRKELRRGKREVVLSSEKQTALKHGLLSRAGGRLSDQSLTGTKHKSVESKWTVWVVERRKGGCLSSWMRQKKKKKKKAAVGVFQGSYSSEVHVYVLLSILIVVIVPRV